jgi:hypothetical protein
MKTIKAGIIGTGFIGPAHVEAARRSGFVEMIALCEANDDLAKAKAAQLGIPKAYGSVDDPLSGRSRDHRRSRYQTAIPLRYDPIIQSIPRGSSLVGKCYFLIPKVLSHVLDQMLRTMRHMQRADKSLVITKSHRDTPLVNVQSRKHIVVPWYKCLASHRSASLAHWLSPLYQSTRCQAQHPSYRSQDERKRVDVIDFFRSC